MDRPRGRVQLGDVHRVEPGRPGDRGREERVTYGPRLVRNFMSDRKNQLVLGVLVSTFIYTLLVVRTIKSPDADGGDEFVPYIAVNFGIVLALIDVALIIYFIHHIADSVQVNTLANQTRRDFLAVIQRWHPAEQRDDAAHPDEEDDFPTGGAIITARNTGFLVEMSIEKLRTITAEHDVWVKMLVPIGSHVIDDTPLAQIWPASKTPDVEGVIRKLMTFGDQRSPFQDIRFAEQQVVEMAVRAMSTGTNDPYTAINAIEEVAAGIALAVSRPKPAIALRDEDGVPRIRLNVVTLREIVDMPFDYIRPFVGGSWMVVCALITLAERIVLTSKYAELRQRAMDHVEILHDQFMDEALSERDKDLVAAHVEKMRETLKNV